MQQHADLYQAHMSSGDIHGGDCVSSCYYRDSRSLAGQGSLTHSMHQPSMLASNICCLLACVHIHKQPHSTATQSFPVEA